MFSFSKDDILVRSACCHLRMVLSMFLDVILQEIFAGKLSDHGTLSRTTVVRMSMEGGQITRSSVLPRIWVGPRTYCFMSHTAGFAGKIEVSNYDGVTMIMR